MLGRNAENLCHITVSGLLNAVLTHLHPSYLSAPPTGSAGRPFLFYSQVHRTFWSKTDTFAVWAQPLPTMEFAELIKTTKVDHVVLSRPGLPSVKGTLCITSHHLLLSSQPGGNEEQGQIELWLLIRNVDAIEKSVQNLSWYQSARTNGSPPETRLANASGTITLKCKDLKILQLEIPGMEECLNIASSIEALSSVESVMMTYPFFYRPQNMKLEDGWGLHRLEEFYQQIAADVMLRSSQPLVGPNRKRCQKDELLLHAVLAGGDRGFVLETRSAQAAKQARMLGGGTEHRSAYPGWKRFHRPLERGRPLQESFIKLVEACNDPSHSMDRWLSKLEASKWLYHVKEALSTACLVAQCMDREEACVLVHGAEGTDTTLLVTALAQVILDPNCRTLTGFQGLLEREWIQAGHPFCLRCAHSAYSHVRLKHEAPTFLLFLDCVWQLGRQFPLSLEFNEGFLLALFEHSYASPYGTFLCNNEKERKLCEVKEKTHSLWPWLNSKGEEFLNLLYAHNPLVIWPSVEPQSLLLWQGLFLRWVRSSHHLDDAWGEIQKIMKSTQED
ncbi:myotubularin-related protein 9-like isoform X3 [Podarcis raffonei]|uniref:myotubularin-related protein 9-like isoform X3 n=1 Tax=Podarcis raffonei TaxID=65483 RepID=UPI0023292043|nr:myotubularin-related protein 9-like isoform X3 [Podarcis raffonei]